VTNARFDDGGVRHGASGDDISEEERGGGNGEREW